MLRSRHFFGRLRLHTLIFTFTFKNCSYVMIVTRRRLSFFARQNVAAGATLKRWLWLSAPANKKIGSGSTLKVTAPAPQHWSCFWYKKILKSTKLFGNLWREEPGKVCQVELYLIPAVVQPHGHRADERLHPRGRLVVGSTEPPSHIFVIQNLT